MLQDFYKDQIVYWLTTPTEQVFEDHEFFTQYKNDPVKRHIYMDMGASVLYVAHLDTVQDLGENVKYKNGKLFAAGLDDRLGAYLAFHLNQVGCQGDILLTDHEEIGMSTAKYFEATKKYNWVCQFDRKGKDFVTYYDPNSEGIRLLEDLGLNEGRGSFSDISKLKLDNRPFMFNLGIGYHKAHSVNSYADLNETIDNLNAFMRFHRSSNHVHFPSHGFDRTEEFVQEMIQLASNENNEATR